MTDRVAAGIRELSPPHRRVLDAMLAGGDTVLFKASRGVGFDRAVALLMKTVP